MTITSVEPQLKALADDLVKAFSGGPGPGKNFSTGAGSDSAKMAASFIAAYQAAAMVNPTKAVKSKGALPPLRLGDSTAIADKGFWDDAWDFVREVAPVVVNALTKDYKPTQPNLKAIVDKLPDSRKNDPEWTDYATKCLLYGCYTTTNCFGNQIPILGSGLFDLPPTPPIGADKGWFDDVCSFVADAAPVVLPIVMSLL